MTVLFLLLAAHIIVSVKLLLDKLHDRAQCACLRQEDVLCFAALHLRYLVTYTSGLACQHGVGHGRPNAHKFGQVYISCKAIVLFILAACGKLQHLLQVAKVTYKIIEVINAVVFHHIGRHKIAHERPYLCGGVGDRCAGRKNNILAAGLFKNGLCFEEHSLRLLTERRVYTFHTALHGGGKAEVLVLVSLIDKDSINAHAVEVLDIISSTVEHFPRFNFCILSGHCGFLSVLFFLFVGGSTVGKLADFVFQLLNLTLGGTNNHAPSVRVCIFHLVKHKQFFLNLVLDKLRLTLNAIGNTLEYGLRHDNHVPIIELDFGIESLATLCVAVCIFKGQHFGIRIESLCTCYKLAYGGILHHNHRLAGSTEAAHLHCCCNEGVCLAGADLVSQQYRLCRCADYGLCLVRT